MDNRPGVHEEPAGRQAGVFQDCYSRVVFFFCLNLPPRWKWWSIQRAGGSDVIDLWNEYTSIVHKLIFSKGESEHEEHVQQVVTALQHHDLNLTISKCSFNVAEVDFLRFRINTEGIYLDRERICAVEEWLSPEDVPRLQIFLGFANFFQRVIKNYSQIAAPLLNLLRTGKD